jgi:hypothetical protein
MGAYILVTHQSAKAHCKQCVQKLLVVTMFDVVKEKQNTWRGMHDTVWDQVHPHRPAASLHYLLNDLICLHALQQPVDVRWLPAMFGEGCVSTERLLDD